MFRYESYRILYDSYPDITTTGNTNYFAQYTHYTLHHNTLHTAHYTSLPPALKLDSRVMESYDMHTEWTPLADSNFSYAVVKINDGVHRLKYQGDLVRVRARVCPSPSSCACCLSIITYYYVCVHYYIM